MDTKRAFFCYSNPKNKDSCSLKILTIIYVFSILSCVQGLGFDLIKSENYCFKISANETDNIRISFSISGKGNDKCLVQFYNPQNIAISDYTGKRHGFVNHMAEVPGIYRI